MDPTGARAPPRPRHADEAELERSALEQASGVNAAPDFRVRPGWRRRIRWVRVAIGSTPGAGIVTISAAPLSRHPHDRLRHMG